MPTVNIAALDSAQGIGFADALISRDAAGAIAIGNMVFNVDQTIGAGQDNYVLTYDDATGEISLEAAVGGATDAIALTGQSLTGSQATSLISGVATWNTTGTPTAFKINITDTASNANSLLMDLQVGGASQAKISKGSSCTFGSFLMQSGYLSGFTSTTTAMATTITSRTMLFNSGTANICLYNQGKIGFTASNPGTDVGLTLDSYFVRESAGIIQPLAASGAGGAIALKERTAPSAPPADTCYIYAQDNGAGKTQLMALFPTGAAQQIAIEP